MNRETREKRQVNLLLQAVHVFCGTKPAYLAVKFKTEHTVEERTRHDSK
jgi:hypothetical protein